MESTKAQRKPGKQRVMVQIWGQLDAAIKRDFKALHIKRDGYLNDLLKREIEHLNTEVDFRNPDGVRQRIQERKLPNRVKTVIELDEEVAKRIDAVLQEKNVARDSFVNRVLFFLVAKEPMLDYLNIEFERQTESSAKPLADALGYLSHPFFHIREANEGRFYTLPIGDFPVGKNGPNLFALNTGISASAWELMNIDMDELSAMIGMTPAAGASHG